MSFLGEGTGVTQCSFSCNKVPEKTNLERGKIYFGAWFWRFSHWWLARLPLGLWWGSKYIMLGVSGGDSLHLMTGSERGRDLGPTVPFEGIPQWPKVSHQAHLLKVLPLYSHATWRAYPLTHGLLGDILDPDYSRTHDNWVLHNWTLFPGELMC